MRNILIVFMLIFSFGCASSVDTTLMNADEHFNYALSLYQDEDFLLSINEFQAVLLQFPGSQITDDAQYYLAMSYFKSEQYLLAAYEYSKLIKDIPGSEFVAESQYMLSECYYQLSPPYQLDQSYTKKAMEEFQAYIDFFPTSEKVEEADKKIIELNQKLAEKEFHAAEIYEKMDYNNAAIKYYQNVVEKFHDTKFAPLALLNKINLLINNDRENEAITDIQIFLAKFPDDENAKEVKELEAELNNKG